MGRTPDHAGNGFWPG
ncbi:MAG: hypothetical protein ACSLFL_15535 [Alphaproteobacteria bacterium]